VFFVCFPLLPAGRLEAVPPKLPVSRASPRGPSMPVPAPPPLASFFRF